MISPLRTSGYGRSALLPVVIGVLRDRLPRPILVDLADDVLRPLLDIRDLGGQFVSR
jgi:hypothetical protein